MKKKVFLAASLLLMTSVSLIAIAQQVTGRTALQTTPVRGHGCVKPGNVSGCHVANDYKAHRNKMSLSVTQSPIWIEAFRSKASHTDWMF
jgi:hypothetical protein